MPYTLPPLPYGYSALEPHIDAKTMEIHHTKHHQAYIDKANKALEGTAFAASPVEEVLRNLEKIPEDKRKAVQNNAGGHANHSIFWQMLSPTSEGKPSGDLAAAIDKAFGGFDAFKEKFEAAALSQFGSGWAWLVKSGETLAVESTPNQDSPIAKGKTPLLGLDVWEHAYYLTYQNRRPEYVKAFWNIVNWKEVERRWKAI